MFSRYSVRIVPHVDFPFCVVVRGGWLTSCCTLPFCLLPLTFYSYLEFLFKQMVHACMLCCNLLSPLIGK